MLCVTVQNFAVLKGESILFSFDSKKKRLQERNLDLQIIYRTLYLLVYLDFSAILAIIFVNFLTVQSSFGMICQLCLEINQVILSLGLRWNTLLSRRSV